ncbi:UNVERIFIED_ORG: hypothetical protein ABIB19_003747 [Arthrobacter sp. UYEF10]
MPRFSGVHPVPIDAPSRGSVRLTGTAFHPSALTYWRKRLAASKNPHRIMEAIAEVVAETGVLTGKRRRALDSTVLDDVVARKDTVTQLIAGIRRFGR